MAHVFISYSRSDEAFAKRLASSISNNGMEVWINIKDIPAGARWNNSIQEGLKICDVMLLIVSQTSMESKHVEDEWYYFLEEGKLIIPIYYQPADIHYQLRRLQYVEVISKIHLMLPILER
ncbi:MAG: toll/interleukin-1 receptor domain-containing protein [Anaerolineae bacterium]|nr:toll/interleukin-1 receptor domain-containing protein [Anaerolineae bacterium]